MKTLKGSDVINTAFKKSFLTGQLLSFEKSLDGKILLDEAELREIMSSTKPLTDVRWFIKTEILGEK